MSYADLRDFEVEWEETFEDGYHIQVEKLGGGTVGNVYTGTWRYIVQNPAGEIIAKGQDFEAARAMTHSQAAEAIVDYYREDVN